MKAFIAIMIVFSSLTAFAQDRGNDGRFNPHVHVDINNNEQLEYRVRVLEETVRNLQQQIYQLQDSRPSTRQVTKHICTMITTYFGPYIGEGATAGEGEAKARKKCFQDGRDRNCGSNKVRCDQVTEDVLIR